MRYQIKFRSVGTLNVDLNNFDFDFLVLVNLDDDLSLAGLWLIGPSRDSVHVRIPSRLSQVPNHPKQAEGYGKEGCVRSSRTARAR